MADGSPLYKARVKASEVLHRVTAAASVTTFLLASCGSKSVQITITTTGAWHLYDPEFKTVANGKGNTVTSLPAGKGLGYLTFFGNPGQTITVAVK